MKNKKKKAFTLVELLAVIVILAVILAIAVPQIMKVIKSARLSSIKDSAMLIAEQADKDFLSQQVLNQEYNASSIPCEDVAKLNDDYDTCSITYNNGVATVKLKGKDGGKFSGIKCTGTKDNMECREKVIPIRNCTYEGELVQGAKYVDGQYTYKYQQENIYDSTDSAYKWVNISKDGWGVILTDKNSTNPVTTKLCTTINDKPIVSMSSMFAGSKATSIDLSSFDTSNVLNMERMFRETSAEILQLEDIDTSNVTNMKLMFSYSSATVLDLSSFDTSNVTNMQFMFMGNKATEIRGLNNFNTSNVTTMAHMFYMSAAESINLSSFDTSNVTNMEGMFKDSAARVINLNNFNTNKVTDMSGMFEGSKAIEIIGLNRFNTQNVTDMSYMFNKSDALNLDLSGFDTQNVTDMSYMFNNSAATSLNLNNFNTTKVTDIRSMFAGLKFETLDMSKFDITNVGLPNVKNIFNNSSLKKVYVKDTNTLNKLKQYTMPAGLSLEVKR